MWIFAYADDIRMPRMDFRVPSAIINSGRLQLRRRPTLAMLFRIVGWIALAAICRAAQPVQLIRQPQKLRTFYAIGDPHVPAALQKTAQPLPVGDITAMAVASDGAIWYGTARGLVRVDPSAAASARHQYFAGKRYLPDERVLQLFADPSAGMWVRTETGVSHIELRVMTLADKAALFEKRVHDRHDRHGLVASSSLATAGDVTTNQTRDDDNDGLWTSMYAAAECFRYAVTKSPDALANARKSTGAVLFLEEVSGKRGFPARSYIRKGEPMPRDGEWHWTEDGQYYWKGDTSSDEIVGHFFLYNVATDLLPDVDLKQRIAATTARIMDHILDHGYYLIDVTGKPTTWGRWSPDYFRENPGDSPLNSMELLSFLKTAAHITGNPRYQKEYQKAALQMGYAKLATRYKELRDEINYSDEELAMLAFYGLFRYEKDEDLLSRYYGPAMDAWWENIVREDNPLWTFIYATGRPHASLDLTAAARTLYRMPIDTIEWTVKNSGRNDVVMAAGLDRSGRPQAQTLLPRDELPVAKWNSNPFDVDGGSDGRSEDDGAAFLLPYWMARYYGFLMQETGIR